MDKNQMKMLSVKSAIERMVQNYISTYQATGSHKEFFTAVERLVASFFVGQQIDNNHLVRSMGNGDLEIRFSTQGHCTRITFLLPSSLKWQVDTTAERQHDLRTQNRPYNRTAMATCTEEVEEGSVVYDIICDRCHIFTGGKWNKIVDAVETHKIMKTTPQNLILEGGIRVSPSGHLETFQNGKWMPMPRGTQKPTAAPDPVVIPSTTEDFDPFEAYERAKKAVGNM